MSSRNREKEERDGTSPRPWGLMADRPQKEKTLLEAEKLKGKHYTAGGARDKDEEKKKGHRKQAQRGKKEWNRQIKNKRKERSTSK